MTLPLMIALERLSPLERAVFLLHDVFGATFDELPKPSGETLLRAVSLRAAPEPMCVRVGRAFPFRRSMEWRLPPHSSPRVGAATWNN